MTRTFTTPVYDCHCGGSPEIVRGVGLFWLRCKSCGKESRWEHHRQSAIAAWNREMKPKEKKDGKES